jgi:DNA helicase-2/ATP-dependent DNA helicase PcrA
VTPESLEGFNEQQIEAITHKDGPALLIAGAGTGKTRTLVKRFVHLWLTGDVWPPDWLVVSFSVPAANEFRQRVQLEAGQDLDKVDKLAIRTIHAHCRHILFNHESARSEKPPRVYDPERAFRILRKAMAEVLQGKESAWSARQVMDIITEAKELGVSPGEFVDTTSASQAMIARVYRRYQELLREENAFDFADLIDRTIRLLETDPELLALLHEQHPYIMVDEAQDTSLRQFYLLRLMAGPRANIMIAAAPAQEIYHWRNTNYDLLHREFCEAYPTARTIVLDRNYRSAGHIVHASACILDPKKYSDVQVQPTQDDGDPIQLVCVPNEHDETVFVVQEIQRLFFEQGVPFNEMAVLARTGAQLTLVEQELLARRIPRDLSQGQGLYERPAAAHVLAYLALAALPPEQSEKYLDVVINVPPRGIGPVTLKNMKSGDTRLKWDHLFRAMNEGEALKLRPKAVAAIQSFYLLLMDLQVKASEAEPAPMIEHILLRTGYWPYLSEQLDGEAQLATIREIQAEAEQYETITEFLEVVRERSVSAVDFLPGEGVQLCTIHGVKGRQFEAVWLIGCEEGLLPHARATRPIDEEGERRLFYVGMTRTRRFLYLLYTEYRQWGQKRLKTRPSRYLRSLPAQHVIHRNE